MRIDIHVHDTKPIELLLESMEKNQIDKAFVCSSAVAKGENVKTLKDAKMVLGNVARAQTKEGSQRTVQEVNRDLAEKLAPYKGKLYGFGKVDLYDQDIEAQMASIVECGLYGVGEIIGIHEHVELLRPVLSFSSKQKTFPIFIHCDFPVEYEDLENLFDLIEEYPDARIIIGHMGGNHWIKAVERVKGLTNCLLDASEVVNYVPFYVAVAEHPDVVAYGSDFPWDLQEVNLARLNNMGLSKEVYAQVMGENLRRFMEW
ncbi:amidohydrolase family protein [Clostridia bacterium]|nr:amidohydrolase family protein [Clostridia bacterium]